MIDIKGIFEKLDIYIVWLVKYHVVRPEVVASMSGVFDESTMSPPHGLNSKR